MSAKLEPKPTLLEKAASAILPPVFAKTSMEILDEKPVLPESTTFSIAEFARARQLKNGTRLPQAIAHRGYKAAYPENTMAAFKGAVKAGANALETDIHLSKDGVVVLSHDANLKRCFGKPEKLIDCEWDYLSTLRTVREPAEPMPRLRDLLEYLAEPGLEDIWVLLDIKLDNDTDDVIRLIASTIASVAPSPSRPWSKRIVLGFWATKYLGVIFKYLPTYPISHISFSTTYARQFFTVPNVSFNMLQAVLVGPIGGSFIKEAKGYDRQIFAWTVNEEKRMRWCVKQGLDGVITDDPKLFLEVCQDYEDGSKLEAKALKEKETFKAKDWYSFLAIQVFVTVFLILFRLKWGWGVEQRFVRRAAVPVKGA